MATRTENTNKAAEIYRIAASLMERNACYPWHKDRPIGFACYAIATVEYPERNHQLCERMRSVFDNGGMAWLTDRDASYDDSDDTSPIARNIRILALCFMAAMVEAGDA